MMRVIYISLMLAVLLLLNSTLYSQISFTQLDVGLPEVFLGDAVWSDFNNNGHLDVLITGYTYGTGTESLPLTRIYRNNGDGTFSDMEAGLFDLGVSKAVAGDLNNNGYNDIAMFGYTGLGGSSYFKLYMNNGDESFSEITGSIPDFYRGDLALGDFNNDGLLDILVAGELQNGNAMTRIYLNNGDFTFTDIEAGITGVSHPAVAAADLNNNQLQDVIISGRIGSFDYVAYIYLNNGDGTFTQSPQPLVGLRYSAISLADYNNDGFIDILMNGSDNIDDKYTVIYKNNGDETFTDINAGIIGTRQGDVSWGDFNNNGLPDLLVTGEIEGGWTTKLYLQTGSDTFTDSGLTFTNVRRSAVVPGDYNNDGRLDFLLIGWAASQDYVAELYRNEIPVSNIPPAAPAGLFTTISGTDVQFNWEQAAGGTTPSNGLSYNLRVGTTSGGYDVIAPMASMDTGFRRVQAPGRHPDNNAFLADPEEGVYYWSVQAIDHCFAGSGFSSEQIFTIGDIPDPTDPPLLLMPPDEAAYLATNVNLEWELVTNALFYTVEIAEDEDFMEISQTHNLALNSYWISNLSFNTEYYWRVSSNNGVFPSPWSETRTFSTIESLPLITEFSAEVVDIDNVFMIWQQPGEREEREEVTGYRIYRNGEMVIEITDPEILSYLDEALVNGLYTYYITGLFGVDEFEGLYESLPSEEVEITIFLIPPQNLTAESGPGFVTLYWESPAGVDQYSRELLGYNVYREGVQLNPEILTELSYTDDTVTNGVLYGFYTRAVYSGGLSEPSNEVLIAPAIPALYPPRDLLSSIEDNEVLLQWYSYHDGEWLSWDNGMNSGGIGTNDPAEFEVAARFETEDLILYEGEVLKYISFVPRQIQCTYSIRVWTNGSVTGDDYDPGDLIVDQSVETGDLVMQEWNIIELAEPVVIDSSQELWIGYHIDTETGYPAGRDAGPAVTSKGDLVNLNGWESLSVMNPNLNYNWNIQGYVIESEGEEIRTLQPLSYERKNKTGLKATLADEIAGKTVFFPERFRDLTGYRVYRNGNEIAEIPDIQLTEYSDFLTVQGVYHYYVTSLYGEYESPQSNIQTVIFSSVEDDAVKPDKTFLRQNYPNPFNPVTHIDFYLSKAGRVELDVFNVKGQLIKKLAAVDMPAGDHKVTWEGIDNNGKNVPSGVYFYRLVTEEDRLIKRMLLLK